MSDSNDSNRSGIGLPPYKDWSLPAVRLLQGPVYHDDTAWELTLRYQTPLTDYFTRIGLLLIVDEPEGLAYLRQLADDEASNEYQDLPHLFRRTRLGYEATLLCVLLREELRRFEEEDVDNRRCVVEQSELFQTWKDFFPAAADEVRLRKTLDGALRKLESLRFVSHFGDTGDRWEVRRILKARLPVQELERLREQLQQQLESSQTQHG